MIYIGIDTGVHTGFAVWHADTKHLAAVATLSSSSVRGSLLYFVSGNVSPENFSNRA